MKRILTTLSQKWPEYLLEILVITIGILGAYALNNWNEGRKAQKQETYLINRLQKELELDSVTLQGTIFLNTSHANRGDFLIENLNNPSVNMDSVVNSVFFVGRFNWFHSSSPTYDEMVSSGQLGILRSDSLKNLLNDYYEILEGYRSFIFYESQKQKESYNTHKNKYFDPSIMTELWKNGRSILPVDSIGYEFDWVGFRSDPETVRQLKINRGVNHELAWLFERSFVSRLNRLLAYIRHENKLKK